MTVYDSSLGWRFPNRRMGELYSLINNGDTAENVAEKYQIGRKEQDEFALGSHQKAVRAHEEGRLKDEIAPFEAPQRKGAPLVVGRDEGPRADTSFEKLAALQPAFKKGGTVTAGNSSPLSDGAAALLLMSREAAIALGRMPRARIRAVATVGSDPTLMLTGPVAATRRVLARAGLALSDIDLFEVNEAFAPVPLMWMRETGVGHERLNVNGGAIALGHPLGASGARIMTTLLHELERRDATLGLQAICCAGGLATATIIERLD